MKDERQVFSGSFITTSANKGDRGLSIGVPLLIHIVEDENKIQSNH